MFGRGPRRLGSVFGATALMVGTAVGAGIFALPYTFEVAGTGVGIAYLLFCGAILGLVNLAYGEIAVSTSGEHQYAGYVEHYLGKRWKRLATATISLGFYGALAAYLIAISNLLFELLHSWLPFTPIQFGLGYSILVGAALAIGLRAVTATEKTMMVVMLCLVSFLIIMSWPQVDVSNYHLANPSKLFFPFGIVLFALSAASAVPDMKRVLAKRLPLLKRSILIGSIVPVIIYILFATVVVGVTGPATTESAVVGLGQVLGPWVLTIGAVFGCVTMTTSFLMLGLPLREMYQDDLHIPPWIAWALVMIPPVLVLVLNWLSFIELLGIVGAFVGGFDGIIIMHMHRKLRTVHHLPSIFTVTQSGIVHGLTYLVFIAAIAYESWIIVERLS